MGYSKKHIKSRRKFKRSKNRKNRKFTRKHKRGGAFSDWDLDLQNDSGTMRSYVKRDENGELIYGNNAHCTHYLTGDVHCKVNKSARCFGFFNGELKNKDRKAKEMYNDFCEDSDICDPIE
jgi:hypothetical protein